MAENHNQATKMSETVHRALDQRVEFFRGGFGLAAGALNADDSGR
jgi:hypothetical protein